MIFRGKFDVLHIRRHRLIGKYETPNAVVNVGLDHILATQFLAGTQSANWYIGLIYQSPGFPTILDNTDTMASHPGWLENAFYNEPDRPQWQAGSVGIGSLTSLTYADFTMNGGFDLDGIFLVDSNQKGIPTGNLWSTAKFSGGQKTVAPGDIVRAQYSLQAVRG